MTPNCSIDYICARTGERLFTDHFHDPWLAWRRDKTSGRWFAMGPYGGIPEPHWLRANPQPKVA